MPDTPNPNPPSWWEHLRGKRTSDINLPAEGPRDPDLPIMPGEALGLALKNYKKLNENAALQGLYDAAGAKK